MSFFGAFSNFGFRQAGLLHPTAPAGSIFLVDADGAYLVDADGAYLVEEESSSSLMTFGGQFMTFGGQFMTFGA